MNHTRKIEKRSEQKPEYKGFHNPTIQALDLLRNRAAPHESETKISHNEMNENPQTESRSQSSFSSRSLGLLFLPFAFAWNFVRTRAWLSGVCALCLVMVSIIIVIPGREPEDEGLGSFERSLDIDNVERYPEDVVQQRDIASNTKAVEKNEGIATVNYRASGKEELPQTQKQSKSSSSSGPVRIANPVAEKIENTNGFENRERGAWLTGKIENLDHPPARTAIRTQKPPKKHRIVLRPGRRARR